MEQLANLGEFIGGVAVVLSLIFVGVQVRASVKQSRLDAYTKIAELFGQWTSSIYMNEDTSELFTRGAVEYSSLSANEKDRFHLMFAMYLGQL